MRKYIYFIVASFLLLSSYTFKPKPHLIVGNWELIDKQKPNSFLSKDGKDYLIERITFSSDEIASNFYLLEKGQKDEVNITFGFKVFEPFDDVKNSILLLKNLCDNKTRIAFSVLRLDKEFLKLKFEKKFSSDNITFTGKVLNFERTAGPPENMPDFKSKSENKH